MAIGVLSNMKVYEDEFWGGAVEVLQQNANMFNAASRGAIRLVPRRHRGQYSKESFFKEITALASRRDVTSTGAATDTAFVQDEWVSVKLNRIIGPVADTLDAFRKIAVDPSEFSFLLGKQVGQAIALDYANSAIRALEAALQAQTNLYHDATDGTIQSSDMVSGLAKMGDAAGRIVCWVAHSKSYYDLVADQLADALYDVTSMTIREGTPATLGRPVIVTDAAGLYEDATPDIYSWLGLVEGAAVIQESEEREIVSDLVTGLDNLVMRIQGEYAFSLGLKGFTWDVGNGGANPTDATLATGSNWDKTATDDKSLAGVIIRAQ